MGGMPIKSYLKEKKNMYKETQFASDITHFTKYAKHKPELNRRETWEETCVRNLIMHQNKITNDYKNINTQNA